MRSRVSIVVGAALVVWLLAPGLYVAQVNASPSDTNSSVGNQSTGNQAVQQGNQQKSANVLRASELIGREVLDSQNQKLGTVRDLVIGSQNGQISFVIMSRSTLDTLLGKDLLAVPFDLFQARSDPKNVQKNILGLNVQPDQLRGAPQFSSNDWSIFGDQQFLSQIHQFYQGFERTASRPSGSMTNPSTTPRGTTR
jgi:sporulation protein YlmC with PRC-barrel domain